MKKTLMLLALAVTSAAGAQALTFNLAGNFGSTVGVNVGVTARNLANLSGYSIDGRLSADLLGSARLNADALVNFDAGQLGVYVGPGVSLGFFGNSVTVNPALTAGVNVPLDGQFGLFGEATYRFLNNGGFAGRVGVTYNF
ncbi:hypothetical protein [Deinococcus maricopensis]|uniref:Outer membrane insertion C-terminal signal n=1 Tax=Deinococcus maricopensis (strain DSM 21211 / LMG 22137 / NRRL B-23946 / LB-34) TaxID=709986 RepID=E8UAJ2_DEIML|nr:hypothetical protein [Deinococcus maricopensis]ADV68081.1 hypothetical protein Deima_2446 [Deinococcus maricopensis DSM 21211]